MSILADDTVELMDEAIKELEVVEDPSSGLMMNAEYFGEVVEPPEDPPPTDEDTGSDASGCYWIIIVGIIAIGLVVGGFVLFAQEPPEWLNVSAIFEKKPTPTPLVVPMEDGISVELSAQDVETLCIESGFMTKEDTPAELSCPGCPVCPDRYQLPPDQEPQMLVDYLDTAELIIQAMIEVKGSAETLAGLINSANGHTSELVMMDSEQFKEIEDAMFEKMDDIGRLLRITWPPGPYDSSNPLLDAHGRLMNAYLYLISMREEFDNAHRLRRPGFIGTNVITSNRFENMLREISFARVGLSLAR